MQAYWSSSIMTKMTKQLMVILHIFFFSKQPNTNDGNKTNNGTADQGMLIFCNDLPYSHNSLSLQKQLFKAALISMHGPFYHNHFIHKGNMSKYFATKDIYKVMNSESQPWY